MPLMDLLIILPMNRCQPKMPPMITATAMSKISSGFIIARGRAVMRPSSAIPVSIVLTVFPCSSPMN